MNMQKAPLLCNLLLNPLLNVLLKQQKIFTGGYEISEVLGADQISFFPSSVKVKEEMCFKKK